MPPHERAQRQEASRVTRHGAVANTTRDRAAQLALVGSFSNKPLSQKKKTVNLRAFPLAQLTGPRCTVGRAKRSPHLYLSQTQTPARTMVARNGLETATAPMPKPGLLPLKRGSVMYSPARAAITYSHPYYTPRTVHGPCRLYHVVDNVVVICSLAFNLFTFSCI